MKIELRQEIVRDLEGYISRHKGFESVEGLVDYILRNFLSEAGKENTREEKDDSQLKKIEQRFRDLGYI